VSGPKPWQPANLPDPSSSELNAPSAVNAPTAIDPTTNDPTGQAAHDFHQAATAHASDAGPAAGPRPAADVLNFPPPTVPGPAPQQHLDRRGLPSLPIVPTQYQDFWRTPRWQVWRSIVALVLFIIFWLAETTLIVGIVMAASGEEMILGEQVDLELKMTPAMFLANNISLALMIPIAMLVSLILFDQRPKWISSVVGGIRWGWLGRCLGVLAVIWAIYNLVIWLLDPSVYDGMQMRPYTWFMIFTVLLTQPLQAAGEEYGFRGVINRAGASLVQPDFKFGRVPAGWLIGGILSSAMFMVVHGAADPWLNLFYFCFGFVACFMTWRTGGLEAAVAMHIVNNMLAMIPLPFVDFSDMFDRSQGQGDWTVLIGIAVCVIGAFVIDRMAVRQGIVRETAPAAEQHDFAKHNGPAGPTAATSNTESTVQ